MSDASPILFAICNANAGVTALIKTGSVLRLFPAGMVPQGQPMPCATFQTVGGRPLNAMDVASRADNERIQIDSWDLTSDGAVALSKAIRSALEDPVAQSANGIGVRTVSFNGRDYDAETKRFRSSFDVSFWTAN